MCSSIFWWILAALYLALAIITWCSSKPVLEKLALLGESDALVSTDTKGVEVGFESTVHKAFRSIIITDIVGFFIAAFAAAISTFIL